MSTRVTRGRCGGMLAGGLLGVLGLASTAPAQPPEIPPPGPHRSYTMYWNGTTKSGYGVNGEMISKNMRFDGAPVRHDCVILYQHLFGLFPKAGVHITRSRPTYMQEHLARIAADLDRMIPDPDFPGIAVIDYECWANQWDRTPNTSSSLGPEAEDQDYRDDWTDYLLQQNPHVFDGMTPAQREAHCKQTYDEAAKEFYLATLNECKRLRPAARWGYYGYPWSFYRAWETGLQNIGYGNHTGLASQRNNELRWLWDAVDVLLPSVYAIKKSVPDGQVTDPAIEDTAEDNRTWIRSNVAEAYRLAQGKPVYVYVWFRYHEQAGRHAHRHINGANLWQMIEEPYLAGADGIIIWDDIRTRRDFTNIQDYMLRAFVPRARAILAKYDLLSPGGAGSGTGSAPTISSGAAPPAVAAQAPEPGTAQHRSVRFVRYTHALAASTSEPSRVQTVRSPSRFFNRAQVTRALNRLGGGQ